MNSNPKLVGYVRSIYRYPVKSMQAEPLHEAEVFWSGITGDRGYAFVKSESTAGFPWLTGREVPELVLYKARYTDPINWRESAAIVTAPDGRELAVASPDLVDMLSRAYGRPVHMMHLYRGCYDAMPISIISTASMEYLGRELGREIDARRFRPNLLVEMVDPTPFAEDRWLNHLVQVGEGNRAPLLRVSRQNVRCAMTNIDPDNAERDPRVLKTLVKQRDELAGIYASVQRLGQVCEGDPIYMIPE